jgi:hypothetical protein
VKPLPVVLGLIGLQLVAAGFDYWRNRPVTGEQRRQLFATQQIYDIFAAADAVTAERLFLRDPNEPSGVLGSYHSHDPVRLSRSQVRRVQRLLRRPSSYDWGDTGKNCIVEYGVLLTFRSGSKTIRIALCFNCDWFGIFDSENPDAPSINSEADFDPVRGQLVSLLQSIYPTDPQIQSLEGRQ